MEYQNVTWLDEATEPDQDGLIGETPVINPMFDEDEWEDGDFQQSINVKFPGWYLVKMTGFTTATFKDVEPWLKDNVKFGRFEKVGWDSGCSYSVGVVFEHGKDAMMFKLRWR